MKIHYTKGYWYSGNDINFVTICGLYSHKHKTKGFATIIEERVNCNSCIKQLTKQNESNH